MQVHICRVNTTKDNPPKDNTSKDQPFIGQTPTGKGKSAYEGKGTYEVEQDQAEWEWGAEEEPSSNQEGPKQEFGGEGIYEVRAWTVVVSKCRSKYDMRPQKPARTHQV